MASNNFPFFESNEKPAPGSCTPISRYGRRRSCCVHHHCSKHLFLGMNESLDDSTDLIKVGLWTPDHDEMAYLHFWVFVRSYLPIGKTERRPAGTRTSRWSWLVRTLWYRKWLPVSVTNNPERWNAPAGAASHTSQLWMEVHFIPRLEIKQGTFPFAASSSNRIPFLYMCVFKSCWFISHSCIVPSSLSFSIHFNRIHHFL